MKIIDLLNKIVNGEKVPKKIMFDTGFYIYDEEEKTYYDEEDRTLWQSYNFKILTDEVEIIEEDKKIEKLNDKLGLFGDGNTQKIINELNYTRTIINELVDEINNLKEK